MRNSLNKVMIVAAVVATLMAAFAPVASASSRNGNNQKFAAAAQTEHEICILEGVNICPPEPLEIVWACFTHSQLAGYECPDMNDHAQLDLGLKLATNDDGGMQAALPQGTCSGVAECNNFIAECIGAGGDYVPEHKNPQGEPNLGSCGPVQD